MIDDSIWERAENFFLDEFADFNKVKDSFTSTDQQKWLADLADILEQNAILLYSVNIPICNVNWISANFTAFDSIIQEKVSRINSFISVLSIPINEQYFNLNFRYSAFLKDKIDNLQRDQFEKLEEIIEPIKNILVASTMISEYKAEQIRDIGIEKFTETTDNIVEYLDNFQNESEKNYEKIEHYLNKQLDICIEILFKENIMIEYINEMKWNLERAFVAQKNLPLKIQEIVLTSKTVK